MTRHILVCWLIMSLAATAPQVAMALEFPEISCVTPRATVTQITGIDSSHASMEGRYTLPDIQEGCFQGWVDQGGSRPPAHCVEVNKHLLDAPILHAYADCKAGTLELEEHLFQMPVDPNCVSGGIHASRAFKTLCPSYRGKLEK